MILSLAACSEVGEEPDGDLVSPNVAALANDLGPSCEQKFSEIVPFSTTQCIGPVSECLSVQKGWTLRTTTPQEFKQTYMSSAWSKCNAWWSEHSIPTEANRVKVEQKLISKVMTSNGTFGGQTCTIKYETLVYDQWSQCASWSLPIGKAPVDFVEVGQKSCTTCDDIDPVASQDRRLACISQLVNNPTVQGEPYRLMLIGQLKYFYEKTGNHTLAINEVMSSPLVVPPCGPPPVTATCTSDIDWRINLCQRMAPDFARRARNVKDDGFSWGLHQCHQVLGLLGTEPADACPETRAAALRIRREIQAATDRDFAAPFAPGETTYTLAQLVERRFRHFGRLENDLETYQIPPAQLHEYLEPIFASMMDWVHLHLKGVAPIPQAYSFDQYLYLLHLRDRIASTNLLTALYPPTSMPPSSVLGPWGQINVVAEALAPLAERVDGFAPVHDFGCTLGACPVTTALDRELANIAVPDLTTTLWQFSSSGIAAQENTLINDWAKLIHDFFGVASRAELLPQAIAKFLPSGVAKLVDVDNAAVPASLLRLHSIVARSEARWRLFETTGRLVPSEGKKIHRLTNLANREKMANDIEAMANTAVAHANAFNGEFVGLVNGIISTTSGLAQLAGLQAEYDRLAADLAARHRQIWAHRRAISTDTNMDQRVRAMTAEVADDFEGELADQFVGRADARLLTVDAADATFSSRQADIASYQVFAGATLEKGQMYQINTSGLWSPTCGLRKMKDDLVAAKSSGGGGFWHDPIGGLAGYLKDGIDWVLENTSLWGQIAKIEPVELDLTNAFTGPEGFTIAQSQGQYHVESASKNVTPGYFGVSQGYSESSGTSNRVDATFISGLRFPEEMLLLPVNEAPVGSLLAVEMPPGATKINQALAVYVVQAPSTTLPAQTNGSRFVLIANDNCSVFGDAVQDTSVNLTIDTFVVSGGDRLMEAFIAATAEVIGKFRQKTQAYVNQGELLITDTAVLQNDAFLLFKQAVIARSPEFAQVPFDELPTAFQRLYSVFVEREINRIDRIVRIAQLDKEIGLIEITLNGLAEQVSQYEDLTDVSNRLKEWNLARLDMFAQSHDVDLALEYVRDYLLPVFELWYPDAVAEVAGLVQVKALAKLTPFTNALGYSLKMSEALKAVATAYENEADFRYNNFSNPMLLVLSIPDPDAQCSSNGPPTGGPPTGGPSDCEPPPIADGLQVEPAHAKAFWDALRAARAGNLAGAKVELKVDPSLLYGDLVVPYHLVCEASLPIVTRLAFMPIRSASEAPPAAAYTWPIHFGESQTFVTRDGTQEFTLLDHLDNIVDRALVTNLVFANPNNFTTRFQNASHVATASGISPFTSYALDFGKFGPQLMNELLGVKQFVLVLEVEAVSDQRANVPVCNAAP